MKLKAEQYPLLCQRIRELEDVPIKDITQIINSEFKVEFDRSSIKYWYFKVFKYKWDAKLKAQNELLEKWKAELDNSPKETKEETLAEELYDLFQGTISKSEFRTTLLN